MTTLAPTAPPAGGALVGFAVALVLTPFLEALGDGDAAPTDLLLARVSGSGSPATVATQGTALHLAYGALAGATLATLEPNYFLEWPKRDPVLADVQGGGANGLVFGAALFLVALGLLAALDVDLEPRRVGYLLVFNLAYGVLVGVVLAYGFL